MRSVTCTEEAVEGRGQIGSNEICGATLDIAPLQHVGQRAVDEEGNAFSATPSDPIGWAPVVPGRLERIEAGQPFTVLVDYAHTDDALTNVLTRALISPLSWLTIATTMSPKSIPLIISPQPVIRSATRGHRTADRSDAEVTG